MNSGNYCKCPVCGSYAIRIQRRRIDRLMSLFTPDAFDFRQHHAALFALQP